MKYPISGSTIIAVKRNRLSEVVIETPDASRPTGTPIGASKKLLEVCIMFELARRNHGFMDPFRQMEELERSFFTDPFGGFNKELTAFKTDIKDEGDHYLLEADLPGFDKNDIHLDLNGDTLTVTAERKSEHQDNTEKYVRCERSYGQYIRRFDVSAVDTESIKAKYDNGVLTLTMPKKQAVLPEAKRLCIE